VSEFARMRRRNINYFKKNPKLIDPGETAESMAAKIAINPVTVKGKKDGGLMKAIEKVKAKEMERGGEAGKGGDLIRVMKELEIMERPDKEKAKFAGRRNMLKKLIGKKEGGEAVPPKFKGFSKLPESVQQKMNPELAEKFGMGGDVKGKKSGNICRGRGIARPGTGFTIR